MDVDRGEEEVKQGCEARVGKEGSRDGERSRIELVGGGQERGPKSSRNGNKRGRKEGKRKEGGCRRGR